MFEQIEGLLENLPPPAPEEEGGEASQKEKDREEVDVEEYKELLKSLEEEHVDTTALREDLGFLRRVQALANKVKEIRRAHAPKEPEHKVMRTEVDDEMPVAEDEQLDDVDSAAQQPQSEEQEQVIDAEKEPQLVERKDDSEAA
ncbi:hypothetical protein ON010_g1859 [Phytophthora cinnamomi]|nr:hypothetical protein ON010_g1859 [Phytophthora cinnamomi]